MKGSVRLVCGALAALIFTAAQAGAACYADYKAKQDDPLRLHYGVIELPDAACASDAAAESEIARRIERGGWMLLDVVGRFDESGLEERRESAGDFYLRF